MVSEFHVFMALDFACPVEKMVLLSFSILCSGHHPAVMKFPSGIITAQLSKSRPKHLDCFAASEYSQSYTHWQFLAFQTQYFKHLVFSILIPVRGNDVWQLIR